MLASIPLSSIQEIEFALGYDPAAVFRAVRSRQYVRGAELITAGLRPLLPYMDIAPNNAVLPLFEASDYLLKQAVILSREGKQEEAASIFRRALVQFRVLASLKWFERASRSELLMIQCMLQLGETDKAGEVLDQATVPDESDSEAGLYWLTQARLRYDTQRLHEALDAAVKSSVYESKDINTFPDALLLTARCYEDMLDFHRARDVYFEVARLFMNTPWGDFARARLDFVMTSGLTKEAEEANITKLFFETEEDMDKLAMDFLDRTRQPAADAGEPSPTNSGNPTPPAGGAQPDQ